MPATYEQIESLENIRLEGRGDMWRAGWDSAELAESIASDCVSARRMPTPEEFGKAYLLLTIAESCERMGIDQGRTMTLDNGDTPTSRAHAALDSMARRTVPRA